MKFKILSTLSLLLSLNTLVSCGDSPSRQPGENTKNDGGPNNDNDVTVQFELPKISPSSAEIAIANQPLVLAASEGSTLQVPSFGISYNNADTVQILRCNSQYKFKVPTGELVSEVDPTRTDLFRYAWVNALASTNSCTLVAGSAARPHFQDLSVSAGNYFYALNPCVLKERSSDTSASGNDLCSFKLAFTEEVSAPENSLNIEFAELTKQLYLAEGKFAASFYRLKSLASAIRYEQEACERTAHVNATISAAFKGLVSLAGFALQTTTGFALTGPLSSLLGVQDAMGLAVKFLAPAPYDPDAPLQCAGVDAYKKDFDSAKSSVDRILEEILSVRSKMSDVDQRYADLERQQEETSYE